MKAVILAAGEGTRLRPLTLEMPKTLIPISGKPIIERIFESLPEEITEVVMVVEHLKDKIKSRMGKNFLGRKVTYVEQGEKKGTFGALLAARESLGNEKFLVLNGDDLHARHELEQFLSEQRVFGLQKMVMPNYYSVLVENGLVTGFRTQSEEEKAAGVLVATGVYTLDSKIFDHPGVEVFGGEYGLPQTILAQREQFPIRAIITEKWLPINSFADLERAHKVAGDEGIEPPTSVLETEVIPLN